MASDRIIKAALAHAAALDQLDEARTELQAAILEDLAAGVPQAELVKATGYSRERLRQIARDAAA